MANIINIANERFEPDINYLENYSYGDRKYLIFMDQGSLFIELEKPCLDRFIFEFLSSDDLAKCKVMKVFHNVAGPILQNILIYFTEGKIESETLETYALGKGMPPKLFEDHFNDEKQMNVIRQNPDFKNFDLTLLFKSILIFMDFNQKLFINENQMEIFVKITKQLKSIRNDLCHNRENSTGYQYHDLPLKIKVYLGDLLEIIQTWGAKPDIYIEKEKIGIHINKIMNGVITNEDFRFMCLLKVIDLVVKPTLNTATLLMCKKKNDENYKDYFLRNKANKRDYKDRFFPKEKKLMQDKSEEIKPDITLHVKMIDICKEWHPALKDDPKAKEYLGSIIKSIRDIRNHILHNILSMTPKECTLEAQELSKCLIDLGKFAKVKELYTNLDVPVIDINQNISHIDFIMHVPYPYSS